MVNELSETEIFKNCLKRAKILIRDYMKPHSKDTPFYAEELDFAILLFVEEIKKR